jgi:serine/threonine protein phosphatase PrpC
VKDGDLYVANVGDCRAVLGSRGGVATALTSDHTAGREDERRRIESSVSAVAGRPTDRNGTKGRSIIGMQTLNRASPIN